MTKGKFIVIEGGDGSGKGTIVAHLTKVFAGKNVVFTREPGGTLLGEKIREILLADEMKTLPELLLFEAARAQHIEELVAPALERGLHVITDRFDASTYAYQVAARWGGKHRDTFLAINREVIGETAPDLYLFCDIDPEIALRRRMSAEGEKSRFDVEKLEFHKKVYAGYHEFLKDKKCTVIDTNTDIPAMLATAEDAVRTELGL